MTPNLGKTPPGTTAKNFTLPTTDDYQTVYDLNDDLGMLTEVYVRNTGANSIKAKFTQARIHGYESYEEQTIAADAYYRFITSHPFSTRAKLEVKADSGGSQGIAFVMLRAVHIGNASLVDI